MAYFDVACDTLYKSLQMSNMLGLTAEETIEIQRTLVDAMEIMLQEMK
jgi:hypothetical protein